MNATLLRSHRFAFLATALALGFALLLALGPVASARAHPLGNFTINHYSRLELYSNAVRVHYILDYAEIPTVQLKGKLDRNLDDRLSPEELEAYVPALTAEVLRDVSLTLDGAPVELVSIEHRAEVLGGQANLDILRFELVFQGETAGKSERALAFSDRYLADRPGWREIVVLPSGGTMHGADPSLLEDRSLALTVYPTESLESSPDMREVTFRWTTGTGEAAPGTIETSRGINRTAKGFERLLTQDTTLGIALVSLGVAFLFGAQHALGPGHGKAMVGAYLVGSRGKPRHAVALGLTVTATHTATVYLLGFSTLLLKEYIRVDRLYEYLGIASGAMVIALGVGLLVSRLRGLVDGGPDTGGAHRHGPFGKKHSHLPVVAAADAAHHTHAPGEDHDHSHEHAHDHDHEHDGQADVSWRSLVTLGVSGGLLPCPSAIVVMLAAISFGKILFGMALIVAFSLGLAAVLSALGIALLLGRNASKTRRIGGFIRRPAVQLVIRAMPVVSAFGVMAAGAYITYQAWNQPGL